MTELMECKIDGGTWIVGTLTVDRFKFFGMLPEKDGTYNATLQYDGWVYYYDRLVPEYDFTLGLLMSVVKFKLTRDNIYLKHKA